MSHMNDGESAQRRPRTEKSVKRPQRTEELLLALVDLVQLMADDAEHDDDRFHEVARLADALHDTKYY